MDVDIVCIYLEQKKAGSLLHKRCGDKILCFCLVRKIITFLRIAEENNFVRRFFFLFRRTVEGEESVATLLIEDVVVYCFTNDGWVIMRQKCVAFYILTRI